MVDILGELENNITPLVIGIIGSLVGAAVAGLFSTGIAKWRARKEDRIRRTATERNQVKECMAACGSLNTLLGAMHAKGGTVSRPYWMQEDGLERMTDLFQTSGHLLSAELQALYNRVVAAHAQLSMGSDPRSPILKEMHELAKSEYAALEKRHDELV
ncbi:MAG: hypothetical protein IS632_00295 [Thaumarchaeota archaeon]|nr:hypothetical protein [Nitrososphaerota archaeon]